MHDSTTNPPVKRCTQCGTPKIFEAFSRNRTRPDGYDSQCRDCRRIRNQADAERRHAYARQWYGTNKERARAKRKAWYEANREKALTQERKRCDVNREESREYSRNWRLNNPEKKRESDRRWHEANKDKTRDYEQNNREKRRESSRRLRAKHPERYRAKTQRRRAKLAGVGGRGVTVADMQAMVYCQQGLCAYCERDGQKLTLDHVIPIDQNGPHDPDNCCMCCGVCNSSKCNRTPEQWVDRWYLR